MKILRASENGTGQRLALDQLHDQEGRASAVVTFEAEQRRHVGVVERREHPRLALEPSQPVGICRDPLEQQFDRHVAAEVHIPGTPDLAHSACTEAVEDFVLA